MNLELAAMEIGDKIKWDVPINKIDRLATGLFDFEREEFPQESITSERAQLFYDWTMTLLDQEFSDLEKEDKFRQFVLGITREFPEIRDECISILDDLGSGEDLYPKNQARTRESFWDLLHPEVIQVAKSRLQSGHPADAVEAALKKLVNRVKATYREEKGEELDGQDLMFQTFRSGDPVIKLADLSTETGENIQEGYKFLFGGTVRGIRNPKAHENLDVPRDRAIHYLLWISHLMNVLDERETMWDFD